MAWLWKHGEDPTAFAWITVGLYIVAVTMTIPYAWRTISAPAIFVRTRPAWRLVSATLAFLGFNKELDMQTSLIRLSRSLSAQSWLAVHRRGLQVSFFLALLLLGVWIVRSLRHPLIFFGKCFRISTIGFALTLLYAITRAASMNHVDEWLHFDLDAIPHLAWLETGGLLLFVWGTLRASTLLKTEG